MKIFSNKLVIAVELIVAIGLVSCHQENVPTPDVPNPASAQALKEGISVNFPKKYQLIKYGDATLSYFDNGKLKKASLGANVRGSNLINTTYAYSNNSVVATVTRNGIIIQVLTYSLDANTGYCNESSQMDYIPLGTNAIQEKETLLSYAYNGKGQLTSVTDKKAVNVKTVFGYNAIGDLNKISYYNNSGNMPGPNLLAEYTLSYEQFGGDPIQDDFSPVNLTEAGLPDQYLKIFGKQSKHLVKMITTKFSPGGKYYNHILNDDGYVTSRQTYNLLGAALVETKNYEYLVTEMGLHP